MFILSKKVIKVVKKLNSLLWSGFKLFKPHLIHRNAHVIAKMRCGAVMVLAKL